tara:strand:- start:743 stop:1186 length:444 start_codon:yes stop_codon:yes gene_type:complete
MTARNWSYWTAKEVRRAVQRKNEGRTIAEIGLELRRTPKAVMRQLARVRASGEPVRKCERASLVGMKATGCHPIIRKILKVARAEDYTFKTLSERVGVSRGTIKSLVDRNTSFLTVVAVADALNISLEAHTYEQREHLRPAEATDGD